MSYRYFIYYHHLSSQAQISSRIYQTFGGREGFASSMSYADKIFGIFLTHDADPYASFDYYSSLCTKIKLIMLLILV